MKYSVDYLTDKKMVCVKAKGRLNFQIAEKYSREAVKLARQNDSTKFLIDHTETIQAGSNMIHTGGEEMQQFGFKNTDRIAVVIANFGNDSILTETVNPNSRWSVFRYFYADNV